MSGQLIQEETLLRAEFAGPELLAQSSNPQEAVAFAVNETLQIVDRGDMPPENRVLIASAKKISVLVVLEM